MDGGFLSILIAVMGPAVEQFLTASQTVRVFVEAFAVSTPAATAVVSPNVLSAAATPEPSSEAKQVIVTSAPCHRPSADAQVRIGAFVSIMMPATGPALVQLPTRSQTFRVSVEALETSTPLPTE